MVTHAEPASHAAPLLPIDHPNPPCSIGWIIVSEATTPTVKPCPRCRRTAWRRWIAGAYRPCFVGDELGAACEAA